MQLHNFFQTIHSALLQTFYQGNWIFKANGRLQFRKYHTQQGTKMWKRGGLCFLTRIFRSGLRFTDWNSVSILPLRTFWHHEAKNTLIYERRNHSESCITVKLSPRTQKVEIYLANKRFGLAFFSTDLGHTFGSNVGNEIGEMFRGKGPHKPEFVYDIVRIHALMLYTDLAEYIIVCDSKTLLLRRFPFISKLKSADILTTEQYKKFQRFGNLQFRPWPKILVIVFTLTGETRALAK